MSNMTKSTHNQGLKYRKFDFTDISMEISISISQKKWKNDGYWLKKLKICNEILRYTKTNIISLIEYYFVTKILYILYNKFKYIDMMYIIIFIVHSITYNVLFVCNYWYLKIKL